jgi:glycosyltransferase involved in cell wall biosynthesis
MLACLARRFAPGTKVVVSRRVSFPPKPNAITRWKYSMPDKFLAVSGEVERVLRNYGIPEERIALVYSAVELARLNVDPIPRAELNVPESVPLLVTAGALVGHKDHANFIEAFHRVRAEFPEAHAVIAGEGELRAQLERQSAELALGDSIHFLGHRGDAPAIIRAADVYVSSSWSEGLGTSVLEALACGTPVVASEAGGIPEMVLHGQTGYLVPNRDPIALADSIVISLRDRDAARRMAKAGQRFVRENFSVDRMVEGTIRVYQELLSAV